MQGLFSNVLVAYDGSPDSQKALKIAEGMVKQQEGKLYVIFIEEHNPHIHPEPYNNEWLNDPATTPELLGELDSEEHGRLADQVMKQAKEEVSEDVDVYFEVIAGPASRRIVQESEDKDADIIVIGNRGLGGLKRLVMGSVSNQITNDASCPVLVTK
ncbi:nucleotide-binding universal stress UspA family protein [Alkalibacillus flavidus]|uniref:Nucleotide-binding universal stress UspA family protein n=1 Tax=Alkalibacillus flavidus TaxID=546021 RepID=A0ABV2KUN0_9BACI